MGEQDIELGQLLAGHIHFGHISAHIADIIDNDFRLRRCRPDLFKFALQVRQDLTLVLPHFKIPVIILGVFPELIALIFQRRMDTAVQPFVDLLQFIPDFLALRTGLYIIGNAGQDQLHFGLDGQNFFSQEILLCVGIPDQIEDQGKEHTGQYYEELIENDMGRKFRDGQKMCAGDNIGRESSPPAHHFTEIDGNENKNTVRHKLIDILEQKISRDRGDHKADQTRQRKLQCILGGSQHGKNTDDTGLGLELQSH